MKAKKMKMKDKKQKKEKRVKGGEIKDEKTIEEKHEEPEIKSNIFPIPIEKYERYMNPDKKDEIIDLLTNSNYIRSPLNFIEIRDELYELCHEGNLELIKLLLSETFFNYSGIYSFKIDKTNQTATLYRVYHNDRDLIVPRSIPIGNKDYLITSVCGTNIYAKTLYFPENSAVKTFYKNAIPNYSKVREIYFPPSLKELKKGWNKKLKELKKFNISPSNDHFQFKEDGYLVGKSDENNTEFDVLLFAVRDIKEISIPSNIKIISSYAFNDCDKLEKVEILENSNLQIIESYAFYGCKKLEKFDIPKNSNLQIIESYAFYGCDKLEKFDIPENSNLQIIESYAFYHTNIKSFFIPSKVSKICEHSFYDCHALEKIKIPKNSNLQIIESYAFTFSKIKKIYLPPNLRELKEGWCDGLFDLNKIKLSRSNDHFKYKKGKYLIGKSDKNKDKFDVLLFVRRDIRKFSISSKIKIISSNAFYHCINLLKVKFRPNSNLQVIGSRAFDSSNIVSISIPSKVTRICPCAFSYCRNLTKVEIPENLNIQEIEHYVFQRTNIESISIPSKVTKICEFAFSFCVNLKKVEIPANSNLKIIESNAFLYSGIESFFIQSKISNIGNGAFGKCNKLQIIEIAEESELKSFPSLAFEECFQCKIMIPSSLRKLVH